MMRPAKASGLMIFRKTKERAHTEQLSHHSDCNVCSVSEGSRFDSRQSLGFLHSTFPVRSGEAGSEDELHLS